MGFDGVFGTEHADFCETQIPFSDSDFTTVDARLPIIEQLTMNGYVVGEFI